MKIDDILSEDLVVAELDGSTKADVIVELAGVVARHHPEIDHARLVQALEDRERGRADVVTGEERLGRLLFPGLRSGAR